MKKLEILKTTFLLGWAFLCVSNPYAKAFFEGDVWTEPERPFLFYGIDGEKTLTQKKEVKPEEPRFATLEDLKKEVKVTLERAVMDPSEANISAYLEMNALLFEKAGRFAESWRDTLLKYPQYDWTATHPVVNFASTKLSRERNRAVNATLKTLKENWGLIYFADDSRLSSLMTPLVNRFARATGLELVTVATNVAALKSLPDAKLDKGEAAIATPNGLSIFPALVALHRTDKSWRDARLLATGVVDITELGRRLERIARVKDEGDQKVQSFQSYASPSLPVTLNKGNEP